jgi:hypothetical protein
VPIRVNTHPKSLRKKQEPNRPNPPKPIVGYVFFILNYLCDTGQRMGQRKTIYQRNK